MAKKLSIRIVSILILVMIMIMAVFTIYFVKSRSTAMEEELLTKGTHCHFDGSEGDGARSLLCHQERQIDRGRYVRRELRPDPEHRSPQIPYQV